MAAYYKKTPTGQPNEIRIDQRTLTFVGGVMTLIVTILTLGVNYGVMRYQLDGKADRGEMREMVKDSTHALDTRVTRNTEVLMKLTDDVGDLKQRLTDVACELVRPRRTYCR